MNFFRLMWRRVVAKRKKLNESSSPPKFAIVKTEELKQLLNVCCDIMEYFENYRGTGDVQKHWSTKKKIEEKNQPTRKQNEVTVIQAEMCTTWDQVERNSDLDGQVAVENPIDCANVVWTKLDEISVLLSSTNPTFDPNFESDSRPDSISPPKHKVSSQEENLSDEKTEKVNEVEESRIPLPVHIFPSNLCGAKKSICECYSCCDCLRHVTDLTFFDDSFDSKSLQLGTDQELVPYRTLSYKSENDLSMLVACSSLNLMAPNTVPYGAELSASSSSVCSTTL